MTLHDVHEWHDGPMHFCAICYLGKGEEIAEWFCETCREHFCTRHHHHHPSRLSPTITLGQPTEPIPN